MSYSTPGFWRRIVSMLYELLLILAVLFIAAFIFHFIFRDTTAIYFKPLFQFYMLIVMGTYFIWFWTHGGQTLAMQTWKIRLVNKDGSGLNRKQAITRYLLALVGVFFFGLGILWAIFDQNHQFLHDRLAGTRIILVKD